MLVLYNPDDTQRCLCTSSLSSCEYSALSLSIVIDRTNENCERARGVFVQVYGWIGWMINFLRRAVPLVFSSPSPCGVCEAQVWVWHLGLLVVFRWSYCFLRTLSFVSFANYVIFTFASTKDVFVYRLFSLSFFINFKLPFSVFTFSSLIVPICVLLFL